MATTFVMDVAFENDEIVTTITSSGEAVNRWLRDISDVDMPLVGLDVEWRPNYRRGQQNPAALLQLCVGRRCLIFQLLRADFIPRALGYFLADPDVLCVGVGVQEDAERLRHDHDLEVAKTMDLRDLAADAMRMPRLRRAGLKDVACAVMGSNLEKPRRVTMSPWDAKTLSDEQIVYACIDAFVSFEVGRKLLNATGQY